MWEVIYTYLLLCKMLIVSVVAIYIKYAYGSYIPEINKCQLYYSQ